MKPKENKDRQQIGLPAGRQPFDSDSSAVKESSDADCQIIDAIQQNRSGNCRRAEEVCKKIIAQHPEHSEALHLLGMIAYQKGDMLTAASLLRKIIGIDPANPVFYCSLAEVLKVSGQLDASIVYYQKALALKPDFAEAYYDLANTYHCQKSFAAAIVCYQKALQLKPDFTEAYYNLGNTHMDAGNPHAAVGQYQRALVLQPDYVDAHFNLGIAFYELGKLEEALASYRRALALAPHMVAAHYNAAIVLQAQQKLPEAVSCYQKAVQLKSDFPEAYNNMGNALYEQHKQPEAIFCFQKALELKPDYADAHYNLGKIYHDQCEYNAASACYQKALQINPDHYKACNNLAKTYQDMRQIAEATFWFQTALHLKPDYAEAHFNLATLRLLTGNFEAGWKGYEWRFKRREWKRTYPHRYARPRWGGENFAGKRLYVHAEQGIGDILQFVRYLPWVKARGGTLIFETIKPLAGLFKNLAGVDKLVMFSSAGYPAAEFDLYIPLASLPGIYKTTFETIPADVPYLCADPQKVAAWKTRLTKEGLKVGLVWAGTDTDPRRACPLKWLQPLSDVPAVRLYGLQKGVAAEQAKVEGLLQGLRMINLGQEFVDFADTAAVVANLDLVISIDTSVAHLAGAMGKPVWVMLPYASDWRWFLDRNDSPWYPTMRLFRQQKPKDWKSIGQQLGAALQQTAAKHTIENPPR